MKIALAVQSLEATDGWSRYACDLSRALASKGHEVHCLVQKTCRDIPWCTQHSCLRAPLHTTSILGIILQWWKTWRTLKRIKPSVLHVICEPYALLLCCIPGKRKTVITLHGSYAVVLFRMSPSAKLLWKRALSQAFSIITVSNFTKNFLKEHEPEFFKSAKLEKKITVIHNAISLSGTAIRQKVTLQNAPKIIISVGAVKKRKGHIQAIRALAAFKKKSGTPFRYEIIGSLSDTSYVKEVRTEIQNLGLEKEVIIRGVIDESALQKSYENADLFLLLSLAEGLYVEGFVLGFIEAAARGIPSIGPNTGGCPEAIAEGISGYICDPENAEEVAVAMEKVLLHGTIDSEKCRKWAEAHDIKNIVSDFEAVYVKTQE